MEETDPGQVVRGKKNVVEAGAPGSVPLLPPMGMPMSPRLPHETAQHEPGEQVTEPGYVPDAVVEPFGGGVAAVEASALLPATPAVAVTPAVPGTPVTPAEPLQAAHVLPATEARILPAPAEPFAPVLQAPGSRRLADDDCCCCCGDRHDGQEERRFDGDARGDRDARDDDRSDRSDRSDGSDGSDRRYGHERHDRHDGDDRDHGHRHDTHRDTQHDKHHDGQGGDGPGNPPGSPDNQVRKPVATDDQDSPEPCACCGEVHPGMQTRPIDRLTEPGTPVTEGAGYEQDGEQDEFEALDPCEDKSEEAFRGLPATQPGTDPLDPARTTTPASRETPVSPVTPLESTPKQFRKAVPRETAAGQVTPGTPLLPQGTEPGEFERLTPMTPGQEKQERLADTPVTPVTEGSGTREAPVRLTPMTPAVASQFTPAVSTPAVPALSPDPGPPPVQNRPVPDTAGDADGTGGPAVTPAKSQKPLSRLTVERPVTPPAPQANTPGNTGNNAFTSGGSPYGLAGGPPPDGNVGPDPNVKFDEAQYNQLIAVIETMKSTLDDATYVDVTVLDAELLLQPSGQKWDPATKLVTRGGNFGGSVDTETSNLDKALTSFYNALEQAKAVFKETDDLAAYDATAFTTEYPGFGAGGMPGGV